MSSILHLFACFPPGEIQMQLEQQEEEGWTEEGDQLCNGINCVASVEIMLVFDQMLAMQIASWSIYLIGR